jgi:hypothetical protein
MMLKVLTRGGLYMDFCRTHFIGEKVDSTDSKIKLLQKWNHRLLPNESSVKFTELVLGESPNKDSRTIKNEWFMKQIYSKKGIFKEPASISSKYKVQTLSGRNLLTYYIRDNDVNEFESDIMSAWSLLKDYFYDKEWWLNEYGQYLEGHLVHNLFLEKSRIIFS